MENRMESGSGKRLLEQTENSNCRRSINVECKKADANESLNGMDSADLELMGIANQLSITAGTIREFHQLVYEIDKEKLLTFRNTAFDVMSHLIDCLDGDIEKMHTLLEKEVCLS